MPNVPTLHLRRSLQRLRIYRIECANNVRLQTHRLSRYHRIARADDVDPLRFLSYRGSVSWKIHFGGDNSTAITRRFYLGAPKHFSRTSPVRSCECSCARHDSGIEAAGIKFTGTRTDLRNVSRARKLAADSGPSFYDWIRVDWLPVQELVEQVDKFRSLGEPPCSRSPSALPLHRR